MCWLCAPYLLSLARFCLGHSEFRRPTTTPNNNTGLHPGTITAPESTLSGACFLVLSSWPGLSRPSASCSWQAPKAVDARDKRGHGGGKSVPLVCHGRAEPFEERRAFARLCHRKSDLPDLRQVLNAEVGQARLPMPSTS